MGEYTGELFSDEAGETREEAPAIQIEWATYYPLVASSVQAALESSQLVPSSGENAAWVGTDYRTPRGETVGVYVTALTPSDYSPATSHVYNAPWGGRLSGHWDNGRFAYDEYPVVVSAFSSLRNARDGLAITIMLDGLPVTMPVYYDGTEKDGTKSRTFDDVLIPVEYLGRCTVAFFGQDDVPGEAE